MNTALPNPPDDLDRLFSDFFKAQLKHPWPGAPRPHAGAGAARAASEPSELAAARAANAPRNTPVPSRTAPGRDHTARARFTLAASVALMLGTCWYLSNGFEPGSRPLSIAPQSGSNMLPDSGADGSDHEPLQKIRQDKATETFAPKVDMDEIK